MSPRRKRTASIIYRPWWRRHPIAASGALILIALVGYERIGVGSRGGDDHGNYHNKVFRVARVIDGDTLDIDAPDGRHASTRIRLWGVDAPETGKGNRKEMHYGTESAAFARRRLLGREVRVVLAPHRTRGKFSRLLAYVHIQPDDRMFNTLLLEHGFAYADWRFEHPHKREFRCIEDDARKRSAGLWEQVTPDQMPQWRQRMESQSRP